MCDVQVKLVAWLDGELSPEEAARVQRHVEQCRDCAGRLGAYEVVSKTFVGYCEAMAVEKTRSRLRRRVPVLAGAVVAAGVMVLVFPRMRISPPPIAPPTIATVSVPVTVSAPAPVLMPAAVEIAPRKTIHKRHVVAPIKEQSVEWQPTETAVQIAIPAEAMFAPGAMPRGMNFIAELSIAPDGSVKQVRLRQ